MRRKPCCGRECRAWLAEHGCIDIDPRVCYLCGFEGPMCDWYIERDAEEEEKRWRAEQED